MDEWILILVLSILLTAICYMAFPLLRLIIHRGKFEKKRARRIALWNSIVWGVLFFILNAIILESVSAPVPAITYFWINYAILAKRKGDSAETENSEVNQPETSDDAVETVRPPQLSYSDEPTKNYGSYNVYGNDIKYTPTEDDVVVQQTTSSTEENAKEKPVIRFCRKCGNKLQDDAVFCNKCGTKIYSNSNE